MSSGRNNQEEKKKLEWIRAHRYNKRHEPRLDDFRSGNCPSTKYQIMTIIYYIRSFTSLIFRWNSLVVTSLAVGATVICYYFHWTFDLPQTFLSIGIVFPISFGIQFCINRRERVLLDMASLKASVFALYSLSREWPTAKQPPNNPDSSSTSETDENVHFYGIHEGEFCEKMKQLLSEILQEISKYISHNDPENTVIYSIYSKFDEILHLLEEIRASDEWIKSVVSRAYQYVRYMINDFERIRTVSDYRTPSTFRGFSFFMLSIFPIIYAPSFANIGTGNSNIGPAIYSAITITLMFVALNNIMEGLEDPFDEIGIDDLNVATITEPVLFMYKPVVRVTNRHEEIRISKILKRTKRDTKTQNLNTVRHFLEENDLSKKEGKEKE